MAVVKNQPAPRRQRKPQLAAVLRDAKEAGIPVRRVRIEADGAIEVDLGEPEASNDSPQKIIDQL